MAKKTTTVMEKVENMDSPPSKSLNTESEKTSPIESNTILTEDAFCNERSQKLFEAIDELQSCGANRDIDLPELVIVGDQSAGKSSLLQSLTDIPFPVAGRLCTRFPTRIVSRRTPGESDVTRISIEAAFSGPFSQSPLEERQQRYAMFTQTSSNFTAAEFLTVVEKATKLMGIVDGSPPEQSNGGSHVDDQTKHFSNDILRIEISGSNRSYFSILDLPGVFQSLTKNLTSQEKHGVRDMVATHMKPSQSVIVCVASGTNDLANQAIFDMASRYDPAGERTVGVITKCDATQHTTQVIELAQNQEKRFHHGWFVVRNRTPAEVEANLDAEERGIREESFFNNLPWNILPRTRRGVQALKKYLADLLCSRIQLGFPTMLEAIQHRRFQATKQLESLGQSRESIEQKRAYLSRVAQCYHTQALAALNGRYGSLQEDSMKLRKAIRDANDAFGHEMKKNGHLVPFADIPTPPGIAIDESDPSQDRPEVNKATLQTKIKSAQDDQILSHDLENASSSTSDEELPSAKNHFSKSQTLFPASNNLPTPMSTPERRKRTSSRPSSAASTSSRNGPTARHVFEIYSPTRQPEHEPLVRGLSSEPNSEEIYHWIRREIEESRGTELQGTLNPDVLPILFHKQASKWRNIAQSHFVSVEKTAGEVVFRTLKSSGCDEITFGKIWPKNVEAAASLGSEKINLLNEHVSDLTSKHLQTNNPAFLQNVTKARLVRFQSALWRYQQANPPHKNAAANGGNGVISMQDSARLFSELHMSNSRNLENEIHDSLKAYYDIARDNFVDFVTKLIVEKFVSSERGPVLLFSPMYVAGLSDQAIEELAEEDGALVRERKEKEETVARLRRAEKIASKYL